MEFEFRSTLPATVDTVWAALEKIENCNPSDLAACGRSGGDAAAHHPLHQQHQGQHEQRGAQDAGETGINGVTVELLDAATRTLRFLGEAKDRRVPGQIKSRATLIVTEHADGSELYLHSDTHILGKLGEFGQPVVRKKTEQVLREFTENLGQRLGETG